ncbi:CLUMA_CG007467, isoform A, partial [Clunio marinus]
MHAMGIHSALAIKRQRKRRDQQKRARERRYSLQSTESGETHSMGGSTRRKHRHQYGHHNNVDSKVVTSIGMLHIGVVFVVFGIFLLGAGLIPDDATAQNAWSIFAKDSWWNELVLTGLFAVGLGIFLIILNSVISKKEDDDLEAYVQSQLTRSRSGHRLERDVETGGLQTRQTKREAQIRRGYEERGLDNMSHSNLPLTPTSSDVPTPTMSASASAVVVLMSIVKAAA